jgi:TRAP-type C4-dicarboxylate transport system substrate-binding protein
MDGLSHAPVDYWINKDTLKKMPPDVRKIYLETWRGYYLNRLVKYCDEERKMHLAKFKEEGVNMYTLTPGQLAKWKELGAKINEDYYYAQMEKKGIEGKKIAARFQALYDKYERK